MFGHRSLNRDFTVISLVPNNVSCYNYSSAKMLEYLLSYGADKVLTLKNDDRKTAIQIAREK